MGFVFLFQSKSGSEGTSVISEIFPFHSKATFPNLGKLQFCWSPAHRILINESMPVGEFLDLKSTHIPKLLKLERSGFE